MSRSVAVVGASGDPSKYSHLAIRHLLERGYAVYPVNPKGGRILGQAVFPSVAEIPVARLDRVSMYVPPEVGLKLVDEIADKGCDELWLNPGSESPELVARAEALGLQVIQACTIVEMGRANH